MGSKKRKRTSRPTTHPRNKYFDNPPEFSILASKYSSFAPYVFYTKDGRPKIDWTDFNATRELTRVLLHNDHGVNWWIPDGQLCPTVPNRSNYIHWIEDLLASDIIPIIQADSNIVRGFDIGTGANCIYPLLGASLLGWKFVGSDVTDIALEWAEKNVKSNPHISELIEIRQVNMEAPASANEELNDRAGSFGNCNDVDFDAGKDVVIGPSPPPQLQVLSGTEKSYDGPGNEVLNDRPVNFGNCNDVDFDDGKDVITGPSPPSQPQLLSGMEKNDDGPANGELNDTPWNLGNCNDVDLDDGKGAVVIGPSPPSQLQVLSGTEKSYIGPPILVGVVKDGETFDFCMCNPPFFETMEEAGRNPKTSCGGTPQEMACPGGEQAFITRIIEDSVQLRQSFRWYTSMVGRKANLKVLISKLWEVGATAVKTTEFVQGQTCRWGLAWSFLPASKKMISSYAAEKNNMSFMLEGLQRHQSAFVVLRSVETFFCSIGASSKLDSAAFNVDVTLSGEQYNSILKTSTQDGTEQDMLICTNYSSSQLNDLRLRVSVFQQIPGTLLVRGSLLQKESPIPGAFSLVFQQLQEVLKSQFSKGVCRR